jgi:hypothetical protein
MKRTRHYNTYFRPLGLTAAQNVAALSALERAAPRAME